MARMRFARDVDQAEVAHGRVHRRPRARRRRRRAPARIASHVRYRARRSPPANTTHAVAERLAQLRHGRRLGARLRHEDDRAATAREARRDRLDRHVALLVRRRAHGERRRSPTAALEETPRPRARPASIGRVRRPRPAATGRSTGDRRLGRPPRRRGAAKPVEDRRQRRDVARRDPSGEREQLVVEGRDRRDQALHGQHPRRDVVGRPEHPAASSGARGTGSARASRGPRRARAAGRT